MHFIVEKNHSQLGVVMVDFGYNEVRIIFLAMQPQARGQGYGKQVLQGLQQAAQRVGCPLAAVVWQQNTQAQRLYQALGFVLQESGDMANKWIWYPQPNKVIVGAG
jgi:ribosomal protein S18 acetylase RimI-like enzyme